MDLSLSAVLHRIAVHSYSLAATVAYLLVPLLLGLLLLDIWWPVSKKGRYPPVAGTIFHQFFHLRRLHDYMTELSRKNRTFRMLTPTNNYIYTCDPANVEHILKTNFANYGKGKYNYDNLSTLFGDGIFSVDGEKWRHQRKVASHEFSTKVLRDFSSSVFRDNAVKLAGVISDAADSNRSFDIQDLLMKTTLDSILKVGLGVESNCLVGSSKEGREFSAAFDDSNAHTLRRYLDPFWKIERFLNVGAEAAFKKDMKVVDAFIYKAIQSKSQQMAGDGRDSIVKEDILSRFLIEQEKDPEMITDQYLRDIILNFILAGRDTSAVSLSWFFYMLCKHPAVEERIKREVEEATQASESTAIDEFSRLLLTEAALNKMQYLHAALTESMRLYAPVPLDGKLCFSDDTLPDGFIIRKGDMIDYEPYAMGRMKFIWGDDAEEFKPERWLDDSGMFQLQSSFKFTVFQAGPRICLGKEFAYRQIKILAATLLFLFKFTLSDEAMPVKYRTMLTLQMDNGLHLSASRR